MVRVEGFAWLVRLRMLKAGYVLVYRCKMFQEQESLANGYGLHVHGMDMAASTKLW